MAPTADHLPSWVIGVPPFREMDPRDLGDLLRHALPRSFDRGNWILRVGEEPGVVCVVETGSLILSVLGEQGREAVMALLGPGSIFGDLGLRSRPTGHGVRALEDGRLLSFPTEEVCRYIGRHPRSAVSLAETLSALVDRAQEALGELVLLDAGGRTARWLCRLAAARGIHCAAGVLISTPVSQGDLAAMVGCSRETVNRYLASFAGLGWVGRRRGRYLLLDEASLRRRAALPEP